MDKSKTIKQERLIKYNKKKIIIISVVSIAIIVGTSLGIYFAVRPKGDKFSKNVDVVSWRTARNEVQKMDEEDIIGIYFYDKSLSTDLDAVYKKDSDEGHDKSKLEGNFSLYSDEYFPTWVGAGDFKWMSIHGDDSTDIQEKGNKFFMGDDKEGIDWVFGNDGAFEGNLWEDVTTDSASADPEQKFTLSETVDYEDGEHSLELMVSGSSIGQIGGSMWIWFKGGQMHSLVNRVSSEEVGTSPQIWESITNYVDTHGIIEK